MKNSLLTMTVPVFYDLRKACFYCIGHGGHSGHGIFMHTYARAGARVCEFVLSFIPYVCKYTMTYYDTMTRVYIVRVVAVMVGGHIKNNSDQTKKATFKLFSEACSCN